MSIRKWLFALGAIVALAVASHGAYWWIAAGELRGGIARWVEDRREAGWTIDHATPTIDGYPLRVRATIGDPDIAGPGPGDTLAWRWRGPRLRLAFRPWAPREIMIAFPGRHRVDLDRGGRREIIEASAGSADGWARLATDGRIESIRLDFVAVDASWRGRSGRLRLGRLGVTLLVSEASGAGAATPLSAEPSGPVLSISAADVTLPEGPRYPLGRTVAAVAIDAKLLGGLRVAASVARSLAAWRDAGGTVEIRRLDVDWGVFGLSSDGTFALDRALRPIAAMTARIRGYRETIDALVETGYVKARDGLVAKLVLGVVARATPGGTSRLTVPVTIQNGILSAGPARLLRMPEIDWLAIDRNAGGGAAR